MSFGFACRRRRRLRRRLFCKFNYVSLFFYGSCKAFQSYARARFIHDVFGRPFSTTLDILLTLHTREEKLENFFPKYVARAVRSFLPLQADEKWVRQLAARTRNYRDYYRAINKVENTECVSMHPPDS